MASKTKTLTVSYGSFSCTLEGFDDPVAVVTAIADHFRALSAADPHFGVEPAVGATGALARAIEQEVDRRVAARLRAAGDPDGSGGGTGPDHAGDATGARPSDDIGASSTPLVLTAELAAPPQREVARDAAAAGREDEAAGPHLAADDRTAAARLDRLRAVIDRRAGPADAPLVGEGPDALDSAEHGDADPAAESEQAALADESESGDRAGPTMRADGYDAWAALVRDGAAAPAAFDLKSAAGNSGTPVRQDDPAEAHRAETAAAARTQRARPDLHADEADLSRLMSETEAKMEDPEGRERRAAISHLKAAVAAKEAARRLGEDEEAGQDDATAFRDDLDAAVRKGSAAQDPGTGPRTDATGRSPTAPLRLVASQRIDVAEAGPGPDHGPERRRREAETAADPGFSAWAEARGATSLADLVEAAAAHTIEVDRMECFSRPQIMRKVRDASGDGVGREDELRAFGTLLRQGRFEKAEAGQFRLAADSRFAAQPRAARG